MDFGLSGKFALVTGGSHGIGLASARQLAAQGCNVAICSRSQQRLDAAMAELKSHGVQLLSVAADLLEAEAADRVMEDRKSTRLNSSHRSLSRMPSSA